MNIQTIALIRLEEARQIVQPPQAVALLVGNPQAQKTLTGGYPSTAVDPSDDNTQSGDTQNGSDGQNSSNDQGTSDDGTGASGQGDQGGVSGAPSDGENNSEENSQTTVPLPMNLQMSPKNNAILWLGSSSWIPPSLTLQ